MSVSQHAHALKGYKDGDISTARIEKHLNLDNADEPFALFRDHMESFVRDAVLSVFGQFSPFTSPILSENDMFLLASRFKATLPKYYEIISILLNKQKYKNHSRSMSTAQWDRYVLYVFCSTMRMRNNQNFSWWALCNACSMYGKGSNVMAIFFGQSVSQSTVMRKLGKELTFKEVIEATMKSLKNCGNFVIGVYDNSQRFDLQKFQRNGKSSTVTLTTCRLYIRPHLPENLDLVTFPTSRVAITYVNQQIPSPHSFPAFERVLEVSSSTFNPHSILDNGVDYDNTGLRVESYASLVHLAEIMKGFRRLLPSESAKPFNFQPPAFTEAMQAIDAVGKLERNRIKVNNELKSFYAKVTDFQRETTEIWRGCPSQTELLLPPVSPEDETTNIGAAKVVLSLLVLYGILEYTGSDGVEGNLKSVKLADGYEEKYLMLVGDGLSQIRVRTFTNLIDTHSYSYNEKREQTLMIQKAMKQVVNVTGDLHGGCFHFLSAIFALYYGSLIQPIQTLLGWKRIRGSDVTKCYQQAAGLALMISHELERQYLGAYMEYLNKNIEKKDEFEATDDSQAAAIYLAQGYAQWMKDQRRNSNDQKFVMGLNFVYLVNLYRQFRVSARNGDAIMIEWLYKEFLGIFVLTGKHHYVQIVLGMIDEHYGRIPAKILHLVRCNRTTPLHTGVDAQGKPMANWMLDSVIELVQKYYHSDGSENDIKSWWKHSSNVMLKNRCERFVAYHYSNAATTPSKDLRGSGDHVSRSRKRKSHDPRNSRKRTYVPSRSLEKWAIAEYIQLTGLSVECLGRRYNHYDAWNDLSKVTTKLKDENEEDRTKRWQEEMQLDDEIAVGHIAEDIFGNNTRNDDDGESDDDGDSSSPATFNSVLDLADIGNEGINEGDDEGNDEGNDEADTAEDERITVGTSQRKIKIRKAKVNVLGFTDIETVGIQKLKDMDLPVVRLRANNRKKRMQIMCQSIDSGNTNMSNLAMEEAFNRARE
jgi:hypothetical protein